MANGTKLEKRSCKIQNLNMKKIYLLALAAIFALNAVAQQKSNVVVFSEDGETFFAFLNGVKQNTTAQSNVKITGIPGDGASLRLVFANSSDQPLKQDLYFVEPNQEHTIKVKRDKKGVLKMKYFGATPLDQSTSTATAINYSATEVPSNNTVTTNTTGTTNTAGTTETVNMNAQVSDPNVNGNSQTVTTTTTTTTNTTGTTNNTGGNGSGSLNMNVGISENGLNMNVNVSGTENGENGSVNMNMSGMETESSETTSTTTTTTTTSSSSSTTGYNSNSSSSTTTTNGNTGYTTTSSSNNTGSCAYAMDEASFSKMKGAIAGNAFDDTKMSTAKTATKGACVSTEQIKQVMALFAMDDDKLAYAKYAYDYTVDKNNFYLLGESLVFDGNKQELNEFIESKR